MTWRLALSLDTLRAQVNAAAPNRSKAADGTIGDAAHRARPSDHNPATLDGVSGVVTAIDLTDDDAAGADMAVVSEALRRSKDPRIKYVIHNGRFFSSYPTSSRQPWTWAPYSGPNAHVKHMHVSVVGTRRLFDSTSPWTIGLTATVPQPSTGKASSIVSELPVINLSKVTPASSTWVRGTQVKTLQGLLVARGVAPANTINPKTGSLDGIGGPGTKSAVATFQSRHRLKVDGVVGDSTWRKLLEL